MFKKYLFAIFATFCVLTIADRVPIRLVPEAEKQLQNSVSNCSGQSLDGAEFIRVFREGEGVTRTDDKYKELIFCIFHAPGFLDDDGNINIERAVSVFPEQKDAIEKILKDCSLPGDNAVDKAFNAFKCYQKSTPFLVKL